MPLGGSLTLLELANRTAELRISCGRCARAGRYRLTSLIAQYGPDHAVPNLLSMLSHDCPRRASGSAYDVCGVHCPDLSELFLRPQEPG